MSEDGRIASDLVGTQPWTKLIVPILEKEYQLTLEEALPSRSMEELSRNQGYAACLSWFRHHIETLAHEYKEAHTDD